MAVIVSSYYPRKIFYYCPVSHSISPRFLASLFAEIYPPRCPFSPASFWLIFLFSGYFLVIFWFFCLSLVPPTKWISVATKQSIFATFFACNPSIFLRFLPVFGRNLPFALPFCFPAFAWLIFRFVRYYFAYFLFIWPFLVFLSLLSTP